MKSTGKNKSTSQSDTTVASVNHRGLLTGAGAPKSCTVFFRPSVEHLVKDEWLTGEDYRLSLIASYRWLQPRRWEKQPDRLKWVTLGGWGSTCGAAERDGDPESEQRADRRGAVCSGTRLPLSQGHTRCCQSVLQVKYIRYCLTPLWRCCWFYWVNVFFCAGPCFVVVWRRVMRSGWRWRGWTVGQCALYWSIPTPAGPFSHTLMSRGYSRLPVNFRWSYNHLQ